MSSPNILLTRIDNRLFHGQVGVTWTSTIGANLLDEVAQVNDLGLDPWLKHVPIRISFLYFLSTLVFILI